jgi:pimeloyl-ACP methyl ester carboxylesterase
MKTSLRTLVSAIALFAMLALAHAVAAQTDGPVYGARLEGFDYPWPVHQYSFRSQGEPLEMAYLDVQPEHPNGQVAVLLHGKNFCSATWEATINVLVGAGYRVIAPDQVGFCKSSKPAHYQFTFQQLASNTHELLASLGVHRATLIGHSTGGMLGIRYALMYPAEVEQLVLVDPIGLEDWKARGVPWQSVDDWYQRELGTTAAHIRAYERATYYVNTWAPGYERWVQMLAGMYRGPGREQVAWDSALLYDMIFTQPVIYEIGDLRMPVLLMIGDKDNTAIGKDLAPPELRAMLGNYAALGKQVAARIKHVELVEFSDLGHAPQLQAPARFHQALLDGMQTAHTRQSP